MNCGLPAASADGPYAGGACFQSLVDADEAAGIQFDAGFVEADVGCVGGTANRNEQVTAFDGLLAGSGVDSH